jgi:hypothetical protein
MELACAWCGRTLAGGERLPGRLRCRACGVATTSPPPTEAELHDAYAGWYRPPSGRFSAGGDRFLRRSRGWLARRVDRIAPPGPVLDVGAGEGALLDALVARGREATGLERRAGHPRVIAKEIDQLEGGWAAVVFWHSLEHLRGPVQALAAAVERIEPRGLLIVALPNAASLQATIFGERWFALDMPRHLVHVPASVLLATLRDLGLTVERVSHVRGGQVVFGWLHGLVGSLPGDLDLYDAIRSPQARSRPMSAARRAVALAAGVAFLPIALAGVAVEAVLRRGGSVYVEVRRA